MSAAFKWKKGEIYFDSQIYYSKYVFRYRSSKYIYQDWHFKNFIIKRIGFLEYFIVSFKHELSIYHV